MSAYPDKLRMMIQTGVTVSNREAGNPTLSYVAYATGGFIFAVIAMIPVLSSQAPQSADILAAFLMIVSMFDYIGIQTLVFRASLTDPSTLAVFPVSRTGSAASRFVLFLLERRMLFYLIPALVVSGTFLLKGNIAGAIVTIVLYALIYLIVSELLFAILPFFRGMAKRYNARAVMEIALLPILSILFIPELFRIRHAALMEIPVLSQFITVSEYAVRSDAGGAVMQLIELLLMTSATGALLLTAGAFAVKIPFHPASGGVTASTGAGKSGPVGRREEAAVEYPVVTAESTGKGKHLVRRLIFHDWMVRQKEERLLQVLLSYAFFGFLLAQVAARNLPHAVEEAVFPAFIVSQIVGFALIANSLVRRGLRLKNAAIFPVDPVKFLRSKLLSSGILIVLANLLVTAAVAVSWKMSFPEVMYGTVFSLYLPVILLLTDAALILSSPVFARHAFLSITSLIVVEIIATSAYIALTMLSPSLGLIFPAVVLGLSFAVWVPYLGRRISAEFPKLLEG